MKIAFRADGGKTIGMGHIMRTLVLAKELAKVSEVFYVCRENEIYRTGIEKVKTEGLKVITVSEGLLVEDLRNIEADILITDSYDVNENYFNETKKFFNNTAYIDDTNLYYFDVDILINQNINAVDLNYKVNKDTKLLLGTDYLMLREEFSNVPKKFVNEKLKDILITVGGSDPNHITEKILSFVYKMPYNFHVVIGPSFDKTNELDKYKNDNIILYHNANMYELMQKCDIAVSACGSTLYELAVCGVPTIGIIIADNQIGIGSKMNELELVDNLGWFNELSEAKLQNSILKMCNSEKRKELSEKAQKLLMEKE